MAELEARDKLIEAMARKLCVSLADGDPDALVDFFPAGIVDDKSYSQSGFLIVEKRPRWQGHIEDVEAALAAIAEQRYAVVPREAAAYRNEARNIVAMAQEMYPWNGGDFEFRRDNKEMEKVASKAIALHLQYHDLARPDPAREG